MDQMLHYDYHDEILEEEQDTIIACLGMAQEKIVHIEKTEFGYRFVEGCDNYYGRTLSQEQFERLIREMQELAGLTVNS